MATIVLDTSAVMRDLDFVKSLAEKAPEFSTDMLLPRELIMELDRIKDRYSNLTARAEARRAVNWISSVLISQDEDAPLLRGQKQGEVLVPGLKGDDAILDCALYNKQVRKRVTILLTEDRNLGNRALVDGLETLVTKKVTVRQALDCIRAKTMFVMDLDTDEPQPAVDETHPQKNGLADHGFSGPPSAPACIDVRPQTIVDPPTRTQSEIPPPITGQNLESEVMANLSNLIDWHVHRIFTDEELRHINYVPPKTTQEFVEVLQRFSFGFDMHLPKRVVVEFAKIAQQKNIDSNYVNKHVSLLLRLARLDYRYKELLHKYDQDAMMDDG